jgi:hypothetical protein
MSEEFSFFPELDLSDLLKDEQFFKKLAFHCLRIHTLSTEKPDPTLLTIFNNFDHDGNDYHIKAYSNFDIYLTAVVDDDRNGKWLPRFELYAMHNVDDKNYITTPIFTLDENLEYPRATETYTGLMKGECNQVMKCTNNDIISRYMVYDFYNSIAFQVPIVQKEILSNVTTTIKY